MSKKEITSEEVVENKSISPTLKYILIFIIFFAIGLGLGYFGAFKYLENEKSNEPVVEEVDELMDITDEEEAQELINSLVSMLDKDPMFYSTKGISVSTMDNTSKLRFLYNYIISNNQFTKEELASEYIGSFNCLPGFITDAGVNPSVSTNICGVSRIKKTALLDASKKLFNDEVLDTSVPFSPQDGLSCLVDADTYLCGNVTKTLNITGELESVFSVEKVTKDIDGTIVIYEKGYLNDKRSNVNNPNDQYDNYYLHSSDSTEYYYELKSADNLTFKHTFKTDDRQNYYYVSTELVKE